MRLIFRSLNVLRSTINAISTSSDIEEIVQSAGENLPNLFDFASFGVLLKQNSVLYIYQDESCPPSFTEEVVKNMARVLTAIRDEPIDASSLTIRVVKKKWKPGSMSDVQRGSLRSHLTLPLVSEGEILGCISLNSDLPNTFDAQDLQFFSVIGYQMAASLRHFQRLSTAKSMAIYDVLTGIYNRRYLEEKLKLEAEVALSSNSPLAIIMVDIDHFKKVNDTFGHPAGDVILKEIASLLKRSVRKMDTVARYGGEEFVLILPRTGPEASRLIAERIRGLIEDTPIDIGVAQVNITVSLGISNFPFNPAKSGEEMIRMADQALYEAKKGGRNKVCVFSI